MGIGEKSDEGAMNEVSFNPHSLLLSIHPCLSRAAHSCTNQLTRPCRLQDKPGQAGCYRAGNTRAGAQPGVDSGEKGAAYRQ
jgi:hypothetical protein